MNKEIEILIKNKALEKEELKLIVDFIKGIINAKEKTSK